MEKCRDFNVTQVTHVDTIGLQMVKCYAELPVLPNYQKFLSIQVWSLKLKTESSDAVCLL